MNDFWTEIVAFARQTTEDIGKGLLDRYGNVQATEKADGSLVTEADNWADLQVRNAIAKQFPEHGVITEETTHIFPATDWTWAIDPIDGTTNFTHGIPIWGTSMGLMYRGTPVFGYVHFPALGKSYYGIWIGESGLRGTSGAYEGDRPIHTSDAVVGGNQLFNICTRSTSVLTEPLTCKLRLVGVCTYSFLMVAKGATLGAIEAIPKIWDIAAVWAILQAAGGVFVPLESQPIFPLEPGKDYGSRPFPTLVAARSELVPLFKPHVQAIADKVLASAGL